MLRLSRLADYATVVMVYMARDILQSHNARDIANQTHISLPTVSKILKLMARKGLLISQRGAKGGYRLAKHSSEISIAEVVSAIDGDFAMTDCSHHVGACNLEKICHARANWRLLSHAIYEALDCVTLADMAKPIANTSVPIDKNKLFEALKR